MIMYRKELINRLTKVFTVKISHKRELIKSRNGIEIFLQKIYESKCIFEPSERSNFARVRLFA